MDAISYSYADKQAKRIKKFIENPDSTSGIVTVPSTIEAGETVTIPAGRTAILPDVLVEGDLVVDGTVFIPSGSTYAQETIKTNTITSVDGVSPVEFPISPTAPTPSDSDNSDKMVTSAWAKFGFSCSLTPNGYLKFPKWLGGVTIQWSSSTANNNSLGGGFNTIVFPIAFANSCLAVSKMNLTAGGGYAITDAAFVDGATTTTGFTWLGYGSNNVIATTPGTIGISYMAIGY